MNEQNTSMVSEQAWTITAIGYLAGIAFSRLGWSFIIDLPDSSRQASDGSTMAWAFHDVVGYAGLLVVALAIFTGVTESRGLGKAVAYGLAGLSILRGVQLVTLILQGEDMDPLFVAVMVFIALMGLIGARMVMQVMHGTARPEHLIGYSGFASAGAQVPVVLVIMLGVGMSQSGGFLVYLLVLVLAAPVLILALPVVILLIRKRILGKIAGFGYLASFAIVLLFSLGAGGLTTVWMIFTSFSLLATGAICWYFADYLELRAGQPR